MAVICFRVICISVSVNYLFIPLSFLDECQSLFSLFQKLYMNLCDIIVVFLPFFLSSVFVLLLKLILIIQKLFVSFHGLFRLFLDFKSQLGNLYSFSGHITIEFTHIFFQYICGFFLYILKLIHLEFILSYCVRNRFSFHLVPYDCTVLLITLLNKKPSFSHTGLQFFLFPYSSKT